MELKRILARDSRRATEKAIELYGKDVFIISSQRVEDQTELIVAVDVSPSSPATGKCADDAAAGRHESAPRAPANFSDAFDHALRPESAAPAPFAPLPAAGPAAPRPAQVGAPAPGPSAAAQPGAQDNYDFNRGREIVELLREEVAALREELALSRRLGAWQAQGALAPELAQLTEQLSAIGVPAGLRALLVASVGTCSTRDEALRAMHELLVQALAGVRQGFPDQGIHALCGPSGAGKSSMVARLALRAAGKHGSETQAIISYKDQRSGAWGQLQLLAAQAGVDCYRAASDEALHLLLDELSLRRSIWIDTPGIDFMSSPLILSKSSRDIHLHALLPMDVTLTNVRKVFDMPRSFWSSLMLSKMDEAAHPWPLLQALCDQPVPVGAVAVSERINATISAFDAERVVSMALAPLLAPVAGAAPAAVSSAEAGARPQRSASVRPFRAASVSRRFGIGEAANG